MAYFAPYIDASGIHMPTYEDRLSDLVSAYRSIFGIDSDLSPSVPDYQLLSVFARALDDCSALVLSAYNSRNPAYASGQALDLLLPQYGLRRMAGETDASARGRISAALSSGGLTMEENIVSAVRNISGVTKVKLHVNDGDTTDAEGIPAHTLALLVLGGSVNAVAPVLFRKKSPGVGTAGNLSRSVADAYGNTHTVRLARPVNYQCNVLVAAKTMAGFDEETAKARMAAAAADYISNRDIGETLIVPALYGVLYAALGDLGPTLCITDIQAAANTTTSRERIVLNWNENLVCEAGNVTFAFTNMSG